MEFFIFFGIISFFAGIFAHELNKCK